MPKEYVNSEDFDGGIFNDAIKIGWTKELGEVQIAALRDRDNDESDWHVSLNRSGLNRMIRILRKARDDAFGADA